MRRLVMSMRRLLRNNDPKGPGRASKRTEGGDGFRFIPFRKINERLREL